MFLDEVAQNLIKSAAEARKNAYCPYSNFPVGACLLCDDGAAMTGVNVENLSFTVGYCAERTAYAKALSEGKRKFTRIAIVAYQVDSFTTPCGACRQFMSEFGDLTIYCAKPDMDKVFVSTLKELLPFSFEGSIN